MIALRSVMIDVAEPKIRAALGKFGFDKHKADTKVGELSGGEKARLLFCLMSLDAPHIMLLDEPTNHLDIDAREALTQALNNYSGAVILVSHDPHLVECVADRLWIVADNTCKPYEDDLDGYRKLIVQQRRKEREAARESKSQKASKETPSLSDAEKKAAKIEQRVADLTRQKDAIENDLAKACASNDHTQLKDLNVTYDRLQKQLAEAEAQWEACLLQS